MEIQVFGFEFHESMDFDSFSDTAHALYRACADYVHACHTGQADLYIHFIHSHSGEWTERITRWDEHGPMIFSRDLQFFVNLQEFIEPMQHSREGVLHIVVSVIPR